MKRLIRESYRLNKKELKGNYNIVFLVKKNSNIYKVQFGEIEADMKKILSKIGQE